MRFNLAQLLNDSIGATQRYDLAEDFPPLEDTGVVSVHGWMEFMRVDCGVWARGFLKTTAPAVCSRCLRRFTQPLGLQMDELFYPLLNLETGETLASSAAEEGVFTLSLSHELDLREAVRQASLTAQPLKPLCRANCWGLCSQCGVNRNESSCGCENGVEDLRYRPLMELLPTLEPES